MVRFILLWTLIIFSSNWGMNDEEGYVSDSSSVSSIDLGEIPTELPDSALETPTHLTERLNREMTILLGSYRSTLPPVLREGLHTPDSYHGSDYEDLMTDDGEPINPNEAFSEFNDHGTGPKWKALQKALKKKKEARLERKKGGANAYYANDLTDFRVIPNVFYSAVQKHTLSNQFFCSELYNYKSSDYPVKDFNLDSYNNKLITSN